MPTGLKDGQSTTGSVWQGLGALADREMATSYVRFGKWKDPELVQGLAEDLSITLGSWPLCLMEEASPPPLQKPLISI